MKSSAASGAKCALRGRPPHQKRTKPENRRPHVIARHCRAFLRLRCIPETFGFQAVIPSFRNKRTPDASGLERKLTSALFRARLRFEPCAHPCQVIFERWYQTCRPLEALRTSNPDTHTILTGRMRCPAWFRHKSLPPSGMALELEGKYRRYFFFSSSSLPLCFRGSPGAAGAAGAGFATGAAGRGCGGGSWTGARWGGGAATGAGARGTTA